ncbi:hypothetical protein GXM_10437 [Nostoc sphaeroides CCNUC1]|uniref:Uncharacterized protein n=1 Tax=Nostoc sphaeroides CCNUC1 TaxID=2653204 RepID=A0A5P8WJQ2_9NOSO|nr:hypothetical protein GXM_10437 [Nostoc sphaeroides CCNUC1]
MQPLACYLPLPQTIDNKCTADFLDNKYNTLPRITVGEISVRQYK